MNRTHYFLNCGHFNSPKNKLQEEAMQYIRSLEGSLILEQDLIKMQNSIKEKIEEINAKHHRCKALVVKFEHRTYKDRIYLLGIEQVNFHFDSATLIHF